MKDNPDTLYFSEDETHYLKSAEAMIDIDKTKDELAKAKAVSKRVTNLGFGDALRKRVAKYADVRDDVRGSQATKRKRNDANDIRTDYVHSFVPDYGHNLGQTYFPLGDGMTLIYHGAHQPNFVSDKKYLRYGYDPDVEYSPSRSVLENTINELKLKKRKHEDDLGFRGY